MPPLERLLCLLAGLAAVTTASAQLPTGDDIARALLAAQPQASAAGLTLRSGTLWLAALRQRVPLVAAYAEGTCQIGYSAYTPGQDFRWLFPDLPPAQRALWLAGFMQHELAHCADQAQAEPAPEPVQPLAESLVPATAPLSASAMQAMRWREVLADLAFARYVDRQGTDGEALIRQLAALRARQHAVDPGHDTSSELLCYLRQRPATIELGGTWLEALRAWRRRCYQTAATAPSGAPPPASEAGASASSAPG